jgi:hypothetical protein
MEKLKQPEKPTQKKMFKNIALVGVGILGVTLGLYFAFESVIIHETTSPIPLLSMEIIAASVLLKEGVSNILKKS